MNHAALISVTDKTGLDRLAPALVRAGYTLLSTGGTADHLRRLGLNPVDVSAHTGSAEILDGRVKTLHPQIHGGILFDRSSPRHVAEAERLGITPIDVVVVNLYDFARQARDSGASSEDAIHHIDIGGPTMLRAAAKNWQHVCPLIDPVDYDSFIVALESGAPLPRDFRLGLATKVFDRISRYDSMIAAYLSSGSAGQDATFPTLRSLRYGENPHQKAQLAGLSGASFEPLIVLQGKELSYNNLLDLDAAAGLCIDLHRPHPTSKTPRPTVVIVKHTNPCGAAIGESSSASLAEVFETALSCDPLSAFGGIVATNTIVDLPAAKTMSEVFLECIVAPGFADDAKSMLASKKNLRLVTLPSLASAPKPLNVPRLRTTRWGILVQNDDQARPEQTTFKSVTSKHPTPELLDDLVFAQTIVKHVKSNAIVFAKNQRLVGVGAGQMSRIDALKSAAAKAATHSISTTGCVMASDAFFPFRDCVDEAARLGVAAIIQPGGSVRDDESVRAADEQGLAMVTTGVRHFRH